ncbi:MAG: hypothetical protein DRJ68_00115 [Thermoprotei archaeon]|nr:MAG: hypothetical protein DRJ62_01535 [Thermoprotei archaeon]RLF23326.1 MAG: hypothetical protein DRJ68_00115 [Thermoprotei archaeon]
MGEPLTSLGVIKHISRNNNIIVKASKVIPRIGDPVYNGKFRVVGSVYDIIGPTSSPYVVVKPSKGLSPHDLRQLKKLYVEVKVGVKTRRQRR